MMFDSLNRHMLNPYSDTFVDAPNFARLAERSVTFDNFYAGSMPCMPARREMHTGRYNFLHRSWGPLEPFDDSMPAMLGAAGIHTHLASDHQHYWEDGGGTYHTRFTTWEFFRGQEGDPWKGHVGSHDPSAALGATLRGQDRVNRSYMTTEAEHTQTRTVDAGLHFLETNAEADRWMLQLELFDPHEPFFAPDRYREKYLAADAEGGLDWPPYRKVTESAEEVTHARNEYAALVSMCDHSLGRVLDFMDEHEMWDDTLLLVNTDHGFLLGERGWWGKSVQPWFNELVHLPMFLWDPRTAGRDSRRTALAQTIDIAPTLLGFFGLEPTEDMQGHDLAQVLGEDQQVRDGALFGTHGGHVNVTDGRYVYMRAPASSANSPLEEFTLMPTHMRSRFGVAELTNWEPAEPFAFTKGLRTMRLPATALWATAFNHGTLLFDLQEDPGQERPLVDDDVELRMIALLVEVMRESDAPMSQYERLGVPARGEVSEEHLQVRDQAERARDMIEPLPPVDQLPAGDLLAGPLEELLELPGAREILTRHVPGLVHTELVTVSGAPSVVTLAATARITAGVLHAIGEELLALR